jgi:hypothetical protein
VDDDNMVATVKMDAMIAVDSNATTAFVEEDEANHLWQ